MNNSGNNPAPLSGAPSAGELERQVRLLRSLLSVALVSMILVSGSLLGYLVEKKRDINRQTAAAQRTIEEYEKVRRNIYEYLVIRLQDYAKTHPDLNPLLEKYGFLPNQAAAPQVLTPAPKAAPPAKK